MSGPMTSISITMGWSGKTMTAIARANGEFLAMVVNVREVQSSYGNPNTLDTI